jgi:hypothetical protein
MMLSRIAATLTAATIAAGALTTATASTTAAAAAVAFERPGCVYKVRHTKRTLNVRSGPGTHSRVIDKLYPGDHTWGSCRKFGHWRRIHGNDHTRRGFTHRHYLKKLHHR